jgi:hypothetical protein
VPGDRIQRVCSPRLSRGFQDGQERHPRIERTC